MSLMLKPLIFKAFLAAIAGLTLKSIGWLSASAKPTISKLPLIPYSWRAYSLINMSIQAPSFNLEALAAVIVPSLFLSGKTALRDLTFSGLNLLGSSS